MKRLLLILCVIPILLFISCEKIQKAEPAKNINETIAQKLQAIDNGYSEETLKALSVAIRNNVLINHEKCDNKNIESKYLNIANSTDGKVLKNQNGDLIEISFENNDNYKWQKNIKKNEILEFALNNNISLTNLSNIEDISENGRVIGLKIGNQYFDYQTLANHFNLESNIIESITSSKNEIIIKGVGNNFYSHFDINKSEQLSINNHNYIEILNIIFDNLTLF
jgi:hypothetical protein